MIWLQTAGDRNCRAAQENPSCSVGV